VTHPAGLQVFTPRQYGYPANFFAEVLVEPDDGTGCGCALFDALVITRSSASQPWQIAISHTFRRHGTAFDQPLTDPSGYLEPYNPVWIDAQALPQHLARYYQALKDTGHPPIDTPFTKDPVAPLGPYYGQYRQNQPRPDGTKATFSFSVNIRDGFYQYALNDGSDIACYAVRVHAIWTGVSGPLLQGANGQPWGQEFPPGTYSQITDPRVIEACTFIPPQQGTLVSIGYQELMIGGTGKRVS
jgi:hypothetical protein